MRQLFTGRRARVAAGLLVGEFTAATQALVIATIMPRIAADLHGYALYGVTIGALLVASAVGMAFAGPLADRFGTRRILGVAFALVGIGLLASSLAHSMPQLAAARALEGLGGGLDYAASFAAIAKHFEEEQRARMFAWLSAMWVVPALVAPSAGALIANSFGWRYAFAAFIPLVALAAALVLPALGALDERVRDDADALAALRLLFSRATFALRGTRHAAFVAFALLDAAFFGADAYVTLALTTAGRLSLGLAGLCVTLGALGWSAASAVQPTLYARYGARRVVLGGAACLASAALGMMAVASHAWVALAFPAWLLGGAGIGLTYPTLTLASLADADEGSEGAISSAMLLAGTIGMAAGVLACGIPVSLAAHASGQLDRALVASFALALVAALGLGAIALLRLPRSANQRSKIAS
ncbi:MAG: MFS transporter [bacterium]|nr:MFS transporter [bacterium]